MAPPREGKEGALDRSTSWSEFVWDQNGYWVACRQDTFGEWEYDYRYPEAEQTPQYQRTPRFPGPDVLNNTDLESASTPSTTEGSYGAYSLGSSAPYITRDDVSGYGTAAASRAVNEFRNVNDSDTESVATIGAESSYFTYPAASQATSVPEDVTQAFGALSIAGTSTSPQQAYAIAEQPRDRKTIRNSPPSDLGYKKLDERYKVIETKKLKGFWRVGRVFMMLWTEPAREDIPYDPQRGPSTRGSQLSRTYLEGTAFTEIRRFVVVGERHGCSICSPIHTYNGQATLKPNLPEIDQHAIIYTSDQAPPEHQIYAGGRIIKERLSKDPIKVRPAQRGPEGESLSPLSRLNYSKMYTIENYARVLNIGMVEDDYILTLTHNSFLKPRESPSEKGRNPRRANSKRHDDDGKGASREKEGGRRRH